MNDFSYSKIEIFILETHLSVLQDALRSVDAGHIGNYDSCLSYSKVIGCWRPLDGSSPYIGEENVLCSEHELKDKEDLCKYMLQRVNAKFEAYPNFTQQKVKEEIEFRSQSDEFFAIELKQKHKVIGNVYLGKRDFNSRELGYVLNEDYQKKGYGSVACKAMIDYFFKQGVHRIYAECAPQNISSWRLMEKIGLKREAHFRKNVSFHNDSNGNPIYWDTYVYAALNPDEDKSIVSLTYGL